jgi:hypothetical protein
MKTVPAVAANTPICLARFVIIGIPLLLALLVLMTFPLAGAFSCASVLAVWLLTS